VAAVAVAPRARAAPDHTLALEVTLDPELGPLTGRARMQLHNTSTETLTSLPLWLYPNHLAERLPALTDITFHWLYPGLFSPAGMEIGDVRVDGQPVSFTVEDTDAGPRTLARVALPEPLPPGGTVALEVAFETLLPRRLGGFGCDGPRCRLMGGFYPMPAHLGAGGWDLAAAPDRVAAKVTVHAPPELTLIVNGTYLPGRGRSSTVVSDDVPYATIVSDRPLQVSSVDAGGVHADFLHRKARPPGSEDQPLPYVREDRAGIVLEVTRQALEFLAAQGLAPSAPKLTMVEAPLRHELVQVHGNLILVSDQIFGIFPVGRLRKYHRFELVRAILLAETTDALARTERPEDRDLAAGVLASYLLEVFTLREFKKIEFAKDLLKPVDFIPAVDQLMYAPIVASSATYFGEIDERDVIRDDVRRFSHKNASARLIYNKLLDLLGPTKMSVLPRKVLGQGKPLRQAAAEIFGGDLSWFWAQWLGPRPRLNYRLAGIKVTERAPGPGVHVEVTVAREGDDVLEPVEVRVEDKDGGARTLVWNARGSQTTLEADLPAGLKSVEVDPRTRLLETSVGSLKRSDDPRYDNRTPRRWRFIYEGLGGLLDVTSGRIGLAAAFQLKRQHDLRHSLQFKAYRSESVTVGAGASYNYYFGDQADRNRMNSVVGAGISASRLDPDFGLALGGVREPGYRVGMSVGVERDTRDYFIDPWRAVGLSASVGGGVTFLESGKQLATGGAGVEALRLFELLPGHVLGIDVTASAAFGQIELPSQLTSASGLSNLRGYLASDLLARANVVGRLQLRDDYFTDLDWNLLHFTTVRALAGTLFADVAAITSCEDYSFARERVYYDVGYSFRVLHDVFGVYQQLFSVDLAFPLTPRGSGGKCLGRTAAELPRLPAVLLVTFLPNF
jgi:hypothetical protein